MLNTVGGVLISREGQRVLTSGWPNRIELWDPETGQRIRSFNEGGNVIRSVALSPYGNLVLSGGDDGVVRLWDLQSDEHREFPGHRDNVMSVAFSPDGRLAYSAGGAVVRDGQLRDGTDFAVRVWDLETGQQLRPLEGHRGMVWSVAVSPDGRYVLSSGNDATPILWDARAGRQKYRLEGHTAMVQCVAFLPPDGRRAVSSATDGTIRLWDVESGQQIVDHFKGPTGRNGCLAASPDGHRLLSARMQGGTCELRYWNLDTGSLIQKLKWGDHGPVSGSFTPDGRHAVWAAWGGLLRMYRLTDIPDPPDAPPRRSPNTRKRSGSSPKTPAHSNPGKTLQKSEKPEEAIAEPRAGIQPKPDDALTHNNLGRTLQDQGKLAEAIAEYQKAIQLKPADALAHNRLGRALQDQGKLAEAIIEYQKAIQVKPDVSVGYSNLGFALQANERSQRRSPNTRRRPA